MITVSITGDKRVDKALLEMQNELSHKVLGAAHLAAAKPLIQREAQLAPIHEGDLSASIGGEKVPLAKANALGEVRVGPRRTRQHRGYHGHLVEKGTKERHNRRGANRGIMPAQPFAEPAFNETHGQVEKNIATELGPRVVKAARRGLKK